jgi:hypothetical protein
MVMPWWRAWLGVGLLALAACYPNSDELRVVDGGVSGKGGTGGSAADASAGGFSGGNGGVNAGGMNAGGMSTGGMNTGGMNTGGMNTGGMNTGGSGGATPGGLDKFIGSWTVASGDSTVDCGGLQTVLTEAATKLMVTKIAADQIAVAREGCTLQMRASGSTATLINEQTCAATTGGLLTGQSTYKTASFTVTGTTAELKGSGTADGVVTSTPGTVCTFDEDLTVTRDSP